MDEQLLATHVDAVFAAAREDFVAERDRRVKQLRADGHREEATALKACRKPTVPAWAVDRLARADPDGIAALLAAGDELRELQRRAASGRGGRGLREGAERVRAQVGELREGARALLAEAGIRPEHHLEEVGQTLFTAAVDPEHHEALRRGVLERPLAAAGFGGVEGLVPVEDADADGDAEPAPRPAPEPRPRRHRPGGRARREPGRRRAGDGADERAAAREREREAERERERRAEQRARLEERAGDLARRRDEHRELAEAAEGEVEELQRRLAAARERADEQRREADRLEDERREATDELAGLEP